MKHIVCVDQGCHWQRWRVPSFWNGFFRWFCQDFWCHIVWALFGLWIDGRFAVDTWQEGGGWGKGGREGGEGGEERSKQQPRIKTRKQNKSVVYWLVGVCRTKSFKSWRGPKRRIHLPKGGPGSACSVPGRPMEEMLWTRRKSRRRRWKEDELDILSSVDSLFCFGGGRRGGGSIENVDRGSKARGQGVVSPESRISVPKQDKT